MDKKTIFLICSVRGTPQDEDWQREQEEIRRYVAFLEADGHYVHWPARDTVQVDPAGGINICRDNIAAIRAADEVHVWWNPDSQGSKFDLGVAMALGKPVKLVNDVVVPDKSKSFEHVVVALDEVYRDELAREMERAVNYHDLDLRNQEIMDEMRKEAEVQDDERTRTQ